MRGTPADATRKYAVVAVISHNMAFDPDSPSAIYRWIEKKPLTEAVKWSSREKFWLMTATCNYGTSDWKSVAQVVKNAGEPYRPKEWYTPKSCERQFKIIMSHATKELKSTSLIDIMQHVAENLQKDYIRDAIKSKEILKAKYCKLLSIMSRLKQGNLSRQEVVNLYSQARKYENEGKLYMEQLMIRQKASLALENSSSGLSEELVKWNTPSAPLLTSLLRSRNTIPVSRTVASNNSSLLQSPVATSKTRSGKLLSLSSSVRVTQGTPTLSKLLEAPANPYIPNSPQSVQKNNQNEVVTDKLVGNTSKKENSQSTSLNRVQVDNVTFPGSLIKSDIFASKRQSSKSPVFAVKNGPKANLNIVNLLSDSENDEDGKSPFQNIQPKNLFGEKKDITSSRIETRATRSQTRAEVSFKQLNDSKVSDGKKDQETVRQHSAESQLTGAHSVDQLIDIEHIENEPLSSGQDVMLNQISPKITRSSMQRPRPTDNLSATRVNTKKISNQTLEEISANFVLNQSIKNVATEYKNVMVGQSRIDNANISGCLIPIDSSSIIKDTIILRKDGQSFPNPSNTVTALDGKFLKQNRKIELKRANQRCTDSINDTQLLSFTNQPIVVVNKIKTPYNIKLSDLSTDDMHVVNNDAKKIIGLNNSSQSFIQLLDSNCSLSDEVIIIDDDVNINVDNSTLTKTKELSSNDEIEISPLISMDANNSSMTSGNSKCNVQLDEKKFNDKTPWNMFGKTENILNISSKKSINKDTIPKTRNNSTIKEDTNSRFIKELGFDFDQSISQTSLSELYNGVEEIVQMHSFDNEELNSLIECGSSLGNETEVRQNLVSLDQGDSSVSESGSTIGAFDTFAQITRVPQNLSSKDIKSASKDSMVVKQVVKDSEHDEGLIQSDEIDDDQTSILSVTGIPILQGVISDVMSKIDSDRVAALNAVDSREAHIDDIVEISSDEDVEIVDDDNEHANNAQDEIEQKKLVESKLIADINRINYETAKNAISIVKEIEKSILNNKNKQNKSDITHIRSGGHAMRKSGTTKDTQEMENTQSEKEVELQVHKNDGMELKILRDNEDKLLEINKVSQENEMTEGEMKNAIETEFEKIAEEKLQCEIASKNTRDAKGILLREAEERKKKEHDEKIIQEMKLKKIEEAEIMKRFKEIETKKEIEKEFKKTKESEMKRIKEAEIQKIKEAELLKRAREEDEAIKTREAQELEKQKADILRVKEAELQRAKEAEIQQIKEAEEMQRAKEVEVRKAKEEEEIRIAKEIEAKKAREAELIKAKETEIRKAKEAEVMKAKEDELRKAKEIEQKNALEAEIKENEKIVRIKEAEFKKINDAEIKGEKCRKTTMDMEVSTVVDDAKTKLNNIVIQKEDLILLKKCKKTVNERSMLETKKTNVKEIGNKGSEVEGSKSKEQEIKKVLENEENLVNEDEIKIVTRTRGLKPEEKCKELNTVSKNAIINNSGTSIKSLEQSPSNLSLTYVESSSTSSNHDGKKQTKYLDSVNKRKTSDANLKVVYDNITSDLSGSSNENIKKENSQLVRTRSSSSFIQCQQLEIKLTPFYSSEYEVGATSKSTVETKTKTSTSTNLNLPRNSETLKMESAAKVLFDSTCGKQLTVSVVKLSPDEVTVQKEKDDQHSDSNSVKQLDNKAESHEEIVSSKTIHANKNQFTLNLRRCGRKRGISAQNDQTQQSKSDKPTLQNGSTTLIGKSSTSEVESPAKRTRSSTESSESKIDSEEKCLEDKTCKKEVLKMVFNNICDNNKYLSTLERQVKDMSTENLSIVKSPVELKDIKKKIGTGEIKKIGDLQVNFLMMSYNAVMINRSDTVVFSDAANFQTELKDNCLVHQKAINSHCNDDKDELNSKKRKIVDGSNNMEKKKYVNDSSVSILIVQSDSDDFSDNDGGTNEDSITTGGAATAHKKMPIDEMLKCIDSSSDELSDKECDNDAQRKERKYNFSANFSDSGEDSDKLDYSWIF